ncbi:DNA cytosine methyltransferase [Acidisphaera sp. L21]|uniref:DNA cytosine methyltransferase n=1 Tax=Acidisphaera sp. L21 TaxID=1641851 RepID=UPI00131BE158|nr:DNA (cytosine-5-)-methyltransferase [Acidisphaera sp. L21]
MTYRFAEFFAGGGLARLGFGPGWDCAFANDIEQWKAEVYQRNFGSDGLLVGDICLVRSGQVPPTDVWWSSFPCQDHSTAGEREGFSGARGSLVFQVTRLLHAASNCGDAPPIVVFENVLAFASAGKGRDLVALVTSLVSAGYRAGALVLDALSFVPQSRPRLLIVAIRKDLPVARSLEAPRPIARLHPPSVVRAAGMLRSREAAAWIWWRLPAPPACLTRLADVVEPVGSHNLRWRSADNVSSLIATVSPADARRLQAIRCSGAETYGTVVLRPAAGGQGRSLAFRLDGVAGCLMGKADLRYQQLCRVMGDDVAIRPFTKLELARMMGLPSDYQLPSSVARTARLTGDGVAVPVVRWLASRLLEPLLYTALIHTRTSVPAAPVRSLPQRHRKAALAQADGSSRLKAVTRGTTLYLLPSEMERLQSVAYAQHLSVHEFLL